MNSNLRNCSFTGVSDIINNGVTTFMVYYDNVDTTVVGLDTDYISLSVTYNGTQINSPIDNQEILNNLSTILNTTSTGYVNSTWYSWNKGIINYTLCPTMGDVCDDNQTTITLASLA